MSPLLNMQNTEYDTQPGVVVPSFSQQDQDKKPYYGTFVLEHQSLATDLFKMKIVRIRRNYSLPDISDKLIKLKELVYPAFVENQRPEIDAYITFIAPIIDNLFAIWNAGVFTHIDADTIMINKIELHTWLKRVKEAADAMVSPFRVRPMMVTTLRTDHPLIRHSQVTKEGSGSMYSEDVEILDDKKIDNMPNAVRYGFGALQLILQYMGLRFDEVQDYINCIKARGITEADCLDEEKVISLIWRLFRSGAKDPRGRTGLDLANFFEYDVPLCILGQIFVTWITRINYPSADLTKCVIQIEYKKLSDDFGDIDFKFMSKVGVAVEGGINEKSALFIHPNINLPHVTQVMPILNLRQQWGGLKVISEVVCSGSDLKKSPTLLGKRGHLLNEQEDRTEGIVDSSPVVRLMPFKRSLHNARLNGMIFNMEDNISTGYHAGLRGDLIGVPIYKGVLLPW